MGEDKYDTLVRTMFDCSPIGFNNDIVYWVGYGENHPESTGGAIIIDGLQQRPGQQKPLGEEHIFFSR